MDDSLNALLRGVGPRLREVRQSRRLTLAQVAGRTGLSVSTLSRLESGKRRPSLEVLIPLTAVYRLPLDDLVGAPSVGDPRIHPRPFRRDGGVYVPLTRDSGDVVAFKLVLPGHVGLQHVAQRSHRGYERLFVLRGRALLRLGDEVAVLGVGEATEFDTRRPHSLVSSTGEVAEVLGLFSRDGRSLRAWAF
ncbi:helix-turn-helix domain-containing protein [Streptomyces sp. NPDC049936]|uniref:helix-turn-helix domain-containing protein n=1 Tax=Streptomyces sp. NPDC049936 TaxID=3365599 RepID=UPI00378E2226